MRIITCASYYGTGSSAITDLLSECNCVFSLGESEYRFLQDPHGISDLEYAIIENNHRHNTSDAIKEFIRYTNSLHGFGYANTYGVFGKEFDDATKEFVGDIVELQTKTWWHKDRIDKGRLFCIIDRCYSLFMRLIKNEIRSEAKYSLLQNRESGYYTSIDEEHFIAAVQRYVERLVDSVNKENKPFVMVDQMVPPTNTQRYVRYFKDVKVIVVDRDPRDVYLLEKKKWKWGIIPYNNVEDYCKWFKITRYNNTSQYENPEKILRIQFEDLVYDYENTRNTILNFVGITNLSTCKKKTKFVPEVSKENTNLQLRYMEESENIKYIEKELGNYLYDFQKGKKCNESIT